MAANPNTNTAARELPSNDHLRLHLGEMTAQEMRTAKAAYQLAVNTLTQQQGGEQEAGEVDGAMVERACEAYLAEARRQNFNPSEAWARSQQAKDWMRAAIDAALQAGSPT